MDGIASNALVLLDGFSPPNALQMSAGLSALALAIAFASRHRLTIIGSAFAAIITAIMVLQAAEQTALAVSAFAVLYALDGFARRAQQSRLRRIDDNIQAMSVQMDAFLDGLDRRTREHDFAPSAVILEDKTSSPIARHAAAAE